MFGCQGGFADKTGDIESTREDIAQDVGFGAVVKTEPGRPFDVVASLVGIAAFGIAEPADAQRPGRGIDLEITSQTPGMVTWECIIDDDTEAQGMVRISVGASVGGGTLRRRRVRDEIGGGMGQAALAAKPLAGLALVVVAIEGQTIAVRAERIAGIIIATFQASE